ncbi:MAG: enoyl-CoA hydratase/isomerase family protein [Candidatus Melainabacteria bacterium]|nr:enoyl-CoA hydratase/isomerase family protein [Candidatus Melainabacteria bacterium]
MDEIRTEMKDDCGWLTINRPDCRNAITSRMWQSISEKISALHGEGARLVVIRGSGSCFAAGADLGELASIESYKDAHSFWQPIKETLDFIAGLEIPTIALIDGPCLGGGCLLATACDLRFASTGSTFGIPVARMGIVLDDDSIARLTAIVGPSRALELLYCADTISGERAEAIGLVNRCVPPYELDKLVELVVAQISQNAFGSIREAKRSVRRALFSGDATGLLPQHESVVISSYLTSDFRRRIKS